MTLIHLYQFRLVAAMIAISVFMSGCGDRGTVDVAETPEAPEKKSAPESEVLKAGDLELSPASLYQKAKIGTEEVEFVYTAVNRGSKPITITEVDSGCACIEESVEPRVIPPGGTAKISAVYLTEKLNGLAEKVIAVSTDQPGVREAFLAVQLEMEPIYVIDQDLTTWSKGDKPETRTVNFDVVRDKPIRLLSAKSSRSEIKAEVEVVEEGKKYKVHLTPTSTGATLLGMVRLTTDCEIEAHARPLLYVRVQ
ncbi:MAG: DUF1573 domain-containing protein [Verrucomicrobiales bacterium]|nr:DUF1573 domain-containing protein [Verrucomicrobiales bacterium]